MPSSSFVLEHLVTAQLRLEEQQALKETSNSKSNSNPTTTICKVTNPLKKSYEKKLLSALKKIVQ
ncbi:hypothetical protein KR067_009147 [Drosophila pandora]|nr:hypothetical protein KR067_009147 [Drosophila pandora]